MGKTDSMLKPGDPDKLGNSPVKEDSWHTMKFVSESRVVAGQWFRILNQPWVPTPTRVTSGLPSMTLVSFDKAEMVKTMKLGGAMIWALDLDDFSNRCGCEHHPLLRTINRVLREYPVPDPGCNLA